MLVDNLVIVVYGSLIKFTTSTAHVTLQNCKQLSAWSVPDEQHLEGQVALLPSDSDDQWGVLLGT
jgi:hypothetical protein